MVSAAPADWATSFANAQSTTLNEPTGITGVAGVTGHLAVITSQEENDFIHALDPNNIWLGGSDAAVEGEWRWITGPENGQQFWQGAVGGSTVGGSYANWAGGEPNNAGNEDTMQMRPDGLWNDQPAGFAFDYVTEWDMSLFVPTPDPDLVARAQQYAQQYLEILDQIDLLAKDTQFLGIGLLNGKNLRTDFNVPLTNFLVTEEIDGSSEGLGLSKNDFLRLTTIDQSYEQIRNARETLRSYSSNLSYDLNIMSVRLNFTKDTIDVHKDGARDLVAADQNEVGAELLALQVRQKLQTQALRLSSQTNVTKLF